MRLEIGMFCDATCNHPPGAAHKSMHTRDRCRNSYFLFNCRSLNADRARKPAKRETWKFRHRTTFPSKQAVLCKLHVLSFSSADSVNPQKKNNKKTQENKRSKTNGPAAKNRRQEKNTLRKFFFVSSPQKQLAQVVYGGGGGVVKHLGWVAPWYFQSGAKQLGFKTGNFNIPLCEQSSFQSAQRHKWSDIGVGRPWAWHHFGERGSSHLDGGVASCLLLLDLLITVLIHGSHTHTKEKNKLIKIEMSTLERMETF